jgi:hypothetical protein
MTSYCVGVITPGTVGHSLQPKIPHTMGFSQWHTAGPTHPLSVDGPTSKGCTYRTPTKDESDRMENHVATPPSSDYVWASRFQHLVALSIHLKRKPRPLYTRGLLDPAKYHQTRVSRSVSPKHRSRWDVALGAHAPLAQGTQAGIYSITS